MILKAIPSFVLVYFIDVVITSSGRLQFLPQAESTRFGHSAHTQEIENQLDSR